MRNYNEEPLFSILIASYNRPKYLKKCIKSIIDSDFSDFEIIISDDCSPNQDKIQEVVESFNNINIKLYLQKKNLREPRNKNFLVSKANGKFNINIGDDDLLHPKSLLIIKNFIDKNKDFDVYMFGYKVIDEYDNLIYSRKSPKKLIINNSNKFISKQVYLSDIFPFWMYHPAVFCCKKGIEMNFQYVDNVGIGEDFQLFYKLFNNSKKIIVIPDYIFYWRKIQNTINNKTQINQSLEDLSNFTAREMIYNNYLLKNSMNYAYKSFIDSYYFRKKFLYNALIFDKNLILKKDKILFLNKKRRKEFEKILINKLLYRITNYPLLDRARRFIFLFGILGVIELLKVFIQKLNYKLKS